MSQSDPPPFQFQPVPRQTWQAPAGYRKPRANAQGIDVAAFILAFFLPLIGAIMGMVSLGQARRAGYKPCSLAVWATIIGWDAHGGHCRGAAPAPGRRGHRRSQLDQHRLLTAGSPGSLDSRKGRSPERPSCIARSTRGRSDEAPRASLGVRAGRVPAGPGDRPRDRPRAGARGGDDRHPARAVVLACGVPWRPHVQDSARGHLADVARVPGRWHRPAGRDRPGRVRDEDHNSIRS
jgi:hypothetical protein